MGFGGQNSGEKARDQQIAGYAGKLGELGDYDLGRSKKTFKFFKKSAKPAMNYWKSLLSGDESAISEFLGPEISGMTKAYGQQKRTIGELGPRGGGTVSAVNNIDLKQNADIGGLIRGVRPQAAQQLGNLASLFSGTSQGFSGQATGAYGQASSNLFGLNQEQEAIRNRRAGIFSGIGQGVGSVFGGWLGGRGN